MRGQIKQYLDITLVRVKELTHSLGVSSLMTKTILSEALSQGKRYKEIRTFLQKKLLPAPLQYA